MIRKIKYGVANIHERGMTLVETLVAVTILSVAIVAPMLLTMQSLAAAYHARDQVIASNLAQEAIEAVRSVRDGNILSIALLPGATCPGGGAMHLLCGFFINQDFTIDTANNDMKVCNGICPNLRTNETLYGYSTETGWSDSIFKRTVKAEWVDQQQISEDEIRITVTVARDEGARKFSDVVISANLYRWVEDGSAE